MRFDSTNDHLRLLFMQDNLWGVFTVGWNPICSNILGLRLVIGSVDGLAQIDLVMGVSPSSGGRRTFPEDIAMGLIFVEAYKALFVIYPNASRTRRATSRHRAFTLEVAIVVIVICSVNHFNAIKILSQGVHR